MRSIRSGLAAATCSLLGVSATTPAEASELDTAIMVYSEFTRVSVFESVTRARKNLRGGRALNLNLVVDIMVGASPNGATQTDEVQFFTRPSGKGSYVIRPGETPLDDTFQDNRVGVELGLDQPVGPAGHVSIGGHASVEYDYISAGVNGSLSTDFDKSNTTFSVGAAISEDEIDPEGGPPIPFESMAAPWEPQPRQEGKKDKTVTDILTGVTQVLSRSTIVALNYSISHSSGYLTDPFKLISVVDGTPGPDLGRTLDYIYEHRPDSRMKQSIFANVKHHLTKNVIGLSYRYMTDDWGIESHTADARFDWIYAPQRNLQTQLRYYHQTAADFYVHSLIDTDPLPGYATADYRLGEFSAYTVALRWSFFFLNGQAVNLRLGYYLQMGDSSPPDAIGIQKQFDLFPSVHALISQVTYSVAW